MSKDSAHTNSDIAAAVSGDMRKTRSAIAALIKKPKCTDKLLARPPFRFLFDVIIAVNAATELGLEQVLTEAEFDSANLKDKPSKLAFLDKVTQHIEARLNTTVDLNSKKVIAGLETEKTRAFLQLLAAAATTDAPIPASDAVKSDLSPGEVTKDGNADASGDNTNISANDVSSQEPSPLEGIIAETRASLTSIISKPKLTDRLLARPPFRFLFDIIVAVDVATDLGLEQVLTTDEYDSTNVTDKASKLSFLNKVIAHIEGKMDTTIDIDPKKVVAGLEPEKTCAFLQLLATAATLPPTSKESGEDDTRDSKDEKIESLDDNDIAIDNEDGVSDALNLTSESQFVAIAKDGGVDVQETVGATDVDGTANIAAESGLADVHTPIETATEEMEVGETEKVDDVEMNDQESGDVVMKGDEAPNAMVDEIAAIDGPRTNEESVVSSNSPVVDEDTAKATEHLVATPCPPVEDDGIGGARLDTLMNVEGVENNAIAAIDGVREETIRVDPAPEPIDLQTMIEAILSVTTPLGQCLGALDVDAMNEEKSYWNNQVAAETGKLEEHRWQQDATVLAPLLQKIDALDAEIMEREKKIEETLERIGGDESD